VFEQPSRFVNDKVCPGAVLNHDCFKCCVIHIITLSMISYLTP
jgi:hypothetical protein